MRFLEPLEIELWELAKKALDADGPEWWINDGEIESALDVVTSNADIIANYITTASPAKVLSLLETLEKTREALADAREHMAVLNIYGLHGAEDAERTETLIERIDALLAGFSGDPSETNGGKR